MQFLICRARSRRNPETAENVRLGDLCGCQDCRSHSTSAGSRGAYARAPTRHEKTRPERPLAESANPTDPAVKPSNSILLGHSANQLRHRFRFATQTSRGYLASAIGSLKRRQAACSKERPDVAKPDAGSGSRPTWTSAISASTGGAGQASSPRERRRDRFRRVGLVAAWSYPACGR